MGKMHRKIDPLPPRRNIDMIQLHKQPPGHRFGQGLEIFPGQVAAQIQRRCQGNRRHREGTRRIAHRLAEQGALRPELSPERAGDIFGVLTWSDTYRNLTRDYGWTFDECETWLTETLTTLLLAPAD